MTESVCITGLICFTIIIIALIVAYYNKIYQEHEVEINDKIKHSISFLDSISNRLTVIIEDFKESRDEYNTLVDEYNKKIDEYNKTIDNENN